MTKKIIIILLSIGLINISCQSQKKDKVDLLKQKSTVVDLLKVNLNNDLNTLLSFVNYESVESEFSEYLNAFKTKEVDNFKINEILFSSKFEVNNLEIPNDSYISLVTKKENKEIIVVHVRMNHLEDEKIVFNHLKSMFGKPELLNDINSINALKNKKNYAWKNFKDNYSLILSQFSEGNIVSTNNNPSTKVNSALIYIVSNNAIIDYPNGQKEEVLERLIKRFSE